MVVKVDVFPVYETIYLVSVTVSDQRSLLNISFSSWSVGTSTQTDTINATP